MMTRDANVDEGPSVDLVAEQAAATAVVDMWLQVWETKDMALFDRAFSHDPDMIIFGTDAAEYWVGYEMARKSIEYQLGVYEDTKGTLRNQVVKVHASGEVAWFTEMMDLSVTSGGERMDLTIWFSGVLEKLAGTWTFVQFHASVPVAGQAIKY
jgi:ketosteroid isomerase-like protein